MNDYVIYYANILYQMKTDENFMKIGLYEIEVIHYVEVRFE